MMEAREVVLHQGRPVTLLLVEDDPGHARLIEKNLRRAGITNGMVKLGDGRAALDYIFGSDTLDAEGRLLRPLLILMDINMPMLDGLEVLRIIKEDARTRAVPVIMLTTADNPREVSRCYELGCNMFITKPVEYEQFCDAIHNLGVFLSVARLP